MTDETPAAKLNKAPRHSEASKQARPWKRVSMRFDAAHDRLTEALAILEQEPNTEHITGNLEPVIESVKRFCVLAADKASEKGAGYEG